jgi:hypothetical protein
LFEITIRVVTSHFFPFLLSRKHKNNECIKNAGSADTETVQPVVDAISA